EVAQAEIRRADDIAAAFEVLRSRGEALYVCNDPLFFTNRIRVNTLALGARLPTMYGFREHVEAGGLMSYGPNQTDLFRRAADYVDKILRGAKPGEIPVESRPSSISSSISPPPRPSASPSHPCCSPAPTR